MYSIKLEGQLLSVYKETAYHDSHTFYQNTQPLFTISLGRLPRLTVTNNNIVHDSCQHKSRTIYTANSNQEAALCLSAINEALSRRNKRHKNSLLYVTTIIATIVITLMISSLARYNNAPTVQKAINQTQEPLQPSPVAKATKTENLATKSSDNALQLRAQSLAKAAGTHRYTVTLSSGHERSIYVFADPECPHCREMEPVLNQLATHYNVVIFPVSVIGGQQSLTEVSGLLCIDDKERSAIWSSLIDKTDIGMAPGENTPMPTACAEGEHATQINNKAFGYYQLLGTPTLLADDGRQIPFDALKSDAALSAFLGN